MESEKLRELLGWLGESVRQLKERDHPRPYYAVVTEEEADLLRAHARDEARVPALVVSTPPEPPYEAVKYVLTMFGGDLHIYVPDKSPARAAAEHHLHMLLQQQLQKFKGQPLDPSLARAMEAEIASFLTSLEREGVVEQAPRVVVMTKDIPGSTGASSGISVMFVDERNAERMEAEGWRRLAKG